MSRSSRAAVALGALLLLAGAGLTAPARAGDLNDGAQGYEPYDDPRYADMYGRPGERRDGARDDDEYDQYDDGAGDDEAPYAEPPYADGYGEPPPDGRYAPDDRRYGEEPRYPGHDREYEDDDGHHRGPPRYAEREAPPGCLPGWRIKQRLSAEGWTAFRDVALEHDLAIVRAVRRATGSVFMLQVDRCTGTVVAARPAHPGAFGAFVPPPSVSFGFRF